MNLIDLLLVAAVGVALFFAIRHMRRNRGCNCGCPGCDGHGCPSHRLPPNA